MAGCLNFLGGEAKKTNSTAVVSTTIEMLSSLIKEKHYGTIH